VRLPRDGAGFAPVNDPRWRPIAKAVAAALDGRRVLPCNIDRFIREALDLRGPGGPAEALASAEALGLARFERGGWTRVRP